MFAVFRRIIFRDVMGFNSSANTGNNLTFCPLFSRWNISSSVESNITLDVSYPFLVKRLLVRVGANTKTGGVNFIIGFRANGVTISSVTIPIGVTGLFEDNTITTVLANQLLSFVRDTTGQSGGNYNAVGITECGN